MSLTEILLIVVVVLALGGVLLIFRLLSKKPRIDLDPLLARLEAFEKGQEKAERTLRDEMSLNREESRKQDKDLREEMTGAFKGFNDSVFRQLTGLGASQQKQLEGFSGQVEGLKGTVEARLVRIQDDNAKKLEEMRKTVDEKLEGTLERRLGESFGKVQESLERVSKGLGEMQSLAVGVGDLKKVLTNVKTRGTWGEVQLGNILEQFLTADQYEKNVATRPDSDEIVEYAVKLPGRDDADESVVWLPIDAKFPKEDYEKLVDAAERADAAAVDEAARALEARIKAEAKSIREKYVDPPHTTDFAILFLPTEGLYAEILRRPGLADALQRDHRITVAGPTTIAAILTSLQMGFRTLQIEKRSSEVWAVLGAVKTEFGKIKDVLGKVQKKLDEAGKVIETAHRRTRVMDRKLRDVEGLPPAEAQAVLAAGDGAAEEAEGEDGADPGDENG
jgi:DNA recombination protein RmuC